MNTHRDRIADVLTLLDLPAEAGPFSNEDMDDEFRKSR
jgi:hypothetical protein